MIDFMKGAQPPKITQSFNKGAEHPWAPPRQACMLYNYLVLFQQLIITTDVRTLQDIHGVLSLQESKKLD